MGFFKKIKKAFHKVTKIQVTKVQLSKVNVIPLVKRAALAVGSGGLSEAARVVGLGTLAKGYENLYMPTTLKQLAGTTQTTLGVFTGNYKLAAQGATTLLQTTAKRDTMGFNLGSFLGGVGGAISGLGASTGNPYLQVAGSFSSAFAPKAAPVNMGTIQSGYGAGLSYGQPGYYTAMQRQGQVVPVSQRHEIIAVSRGATKSVLAPLVRKVQTALGQMVGFSSILSLIRKLSNMSLSPAAIALTIGLTLTELAQFITASSHVKRRQINPANVKALRRSVRRLKSFHKLCGKVDVLRARHTRSSSPFKKRCRR